QEAETARVVGYAADGRLITGGQACKLLVWKDGKRTPLIAEGASWRLLNVDPRGDRVNAYTGREGIAHDLTTNKRVGKGIVCDNSAVAGCGRTLCALYATGTQSRKLEFWSPHSTSRIFSVVPHEGFVGGLVWSSDGRFLATAGPAGDVRVWDAERGTRSV